MYEGGGRHFSEPTGEAMTLREQIDQLRPQQREVLGLICMGQTAGHHPRTLAAGVALTPTSVR